MPRNGSGVYSLPGGSTVTNGDTSDATDINTPLADIVSDLNTARPVVAGGTGATTASGARTALGLAIGTDVQAYDATLNSIAALGTAADKIAYTTGVDTWAEASITSAGRALLDDADASAQRTTLGLGTAAVAALIDEDDLSSDDATAAPSQQSVKAYVDTQIAAINTGYTWATEQATTSGTAVDFTGIPSTVTEIIVVFRNVGGDSTGNILVQVGTSGGFVTSGYTSASLNNSSTSGFHVFCNTGTVYGNMTLTKAPSGNEWTSSHVGRYGATTPLYGGGDVNAAGTLTQVRVTLSAGNFDSGEVYIGYR